MSMTPGASLDAAIAGITRGVDNARKVATEINKESSASTSGGSSTPAGKGNSTSRLGGNLDVTA